MSARKLYVIADVGSRGAFVPLQLMRIRVKRRRWAGGCIGGARGVEVGPGLFVSRASSELLSTSSRWWIVEASSRFGAYSAIAQLEGGAVNLYRRPHSHFDSDGHVLAHKGINQRRKPR